MVRFIHTADWQIGKAFARYGEAAPRLREARLDAIDTLASLASREHAPHVLVAGDVYDGEALTAVTRRGPMERMRRHPEVTWWLLPGNHDPHRAGGLWDRVLADGLPDNVRLLADPVPFEMEPGAFLLPAPLRSKGEGRDLTAWMDTASTPEGAIRIGLAHGAVRSFSLSQDSSNPVDPGRRASAGLAYLGLGDWHAHVNVTEGVWYSGTPEPDRHTRTGVGTALVVEATPGAVAEPQLVETGQYSWLQVEEEILGDEAAGRSRPERPPGRLSRCGYRERWALPADGSWWRRSSGSKRWWRTSI
jgi:DNA repair exonuclease SbcCD nuclease subunit